MTATRLGPRLVLPLLLALIVLAAFAVPTWPAPAPIASGGLGLSRAEWNAHHTLTLDSGSSERRQDFYDNQLRVFFWPEGWLAADQARIKVISSSQDHSASEARAASRGLLPADAVLQRTVADPNMAFGFIDVYHSAALRDQFPGRLFAADPWGGRPPGTFYVEYSHIFYIAIPSEMNIPPSQLAGIEAAPSVTPP